MTTEHKPADAPLTLSQLRSKMPRFRDAEVEGLGTFRLHRLPAIDVLMYQIEMGKIADENGEADRDKVLDVSAALCAKSLGGDFNTPEGVEVIKGMPLNAQLELTRECAALHFLNNSDRTEAIEEAKNE